MAWCCGKFFTGGKTNERASFFFSSRRRHTMSYGDWSSDVCSSDLRGTRASAGRRVPGECAACHARAEGSRRGEPLDEEALAPERHRPRARRHDLEPLVARRRQDLPQFAGRKLHAEGEPAHVPRRPVRDPVAARARGPAARGGRVPPRAAQDQAPRQEGEGHGLRRSPGDHRRGGREAASVVAQSRQRRGDCRAPRQSRGARALEERAADEGGDGQARGDAEMTAARKYNAEQLMNVVLAPVVSEKSTFVADKNRQYVFRVADRATKPQIKAAIELMFKTKVDDVTVLNVRGKERRFGRWVGRRRNWRKAYVRLAAGQEINFAATE